MPAIPTQSAIELRVPLRVVRLNPIGQDASWRVLSDFARRLFGLGHTNGFSLTSVVRALSSPQTEPSTKDAEESSDHGCPRH